MKYYITNKGRVKLEEGRIKDVAGAVKTKYHGWRGRKNIQGVKRLSKGLETAKNNPDHFIKRAGGLSFHADRSQENAKRTLQTKASKAYDHLQKAGHSKGESFLKVVGAGGQPVKDLLGNVRSQKDPAEPNP